ncbi:F0F1 ATP synthase subunit B [Sulfurovum sp. XGS-02]|uniref:F0F1 ATP synthase subunit B family protein n=1 Tax=Sulfurovum sp. XGS-02 TaxID=2925411 RepID=UPI002061CFEF|nr:F0F1 ATP synthase subunit B [Sulfurovum sp. XGS-02]UPT77011.1 F0F1 ATP synthase subunit B [Sulfurovum sp. XGS-02]
MKKIVLLSLLMVPAVLLASGGDAESSRYFAQTGRESDFWPRVINFTIFAALLYYLIANPIKNFFKGRSEDIATQLNEIEKKLQAAKDEKKEAQNRLDESKKRAEEILADAKAEAILLAEKIATANQNELALLDKQLEEKMSLEERKAAREAIDEILSENITADDIMLDEAKVVEIISKKVA